MHKLRIECKKLRYAAEFFMPVFAGMDDFIGHMKGLQDLLGVMNDVPQDVWAEACKAGGYSKRMAKDQDDPNLQR